MKFGLIYPPKKSDKMRTKRFLDSKKIAMQKVTGLIEIPSDVETLKNDLEKIGNTLISIAGAPPTSNKALQKFNILNNLFKKAIREREKNPSVVNFLITNLSTTEIELLREA